jgi:hypothetical protein
MSKARLIKAFEERVRLPVDLNDAADWILKRQIQNEINFIGVELDTGVIRGFLKRFRRPKGGWDIEPDDVSNIFYDNRQSIEWQNMVCAKELLHILDAACVSSKEQFEKLTQRLSLPDEMRHLMEDPDFALVDKFGTAPACALLLPMAARNIVLPAYKAGVFTAADIAKQAEMPVEHVRTVMSDDWPTLYQLILMSNIGERRDSDNEQKPARQVQGRRTRTGNR